MVLCTAVAGPMMLVTAQLANLNIRGTDDFLPQLHETVVNVGLISMVGAGWVCAIYLSAGLGTALSHINVLVFAGSAVAYGLALQTCRHDVGTTGSKVRIACMHPFQVQACSATKSWGEWSDLLGAGALHVHLGIPTKHPADSGNEHYQPYGALSSWAACLHKVQ